MHAPNGSEQSHVIDIQLPAQYGASPTIERIQAYLKDVSSLLSSPLARALVDRHPNAVAADVTGTPPAGIEDVWEWAGLVGEGLRAEELADTRELVLAGLCRSDLADDVSRLWRCR